MPKEPFHIVVKVWADKHGQHQFEFPYHRDYPLYELEGTDVPMQILEIRKIPAGASGDGASAPFRKQKALLASQAHDYAYSVIRKMKNRKNARALQKVADDFFHRDMLELDQQPRWRAGYFWLGLRCFGWYACRYQK